jgi:hypothetical protein
MARDPAGIGGHKQTSRDGSEEYTVCILAPESRLHRHDSQSIWPCYAHWWMGRTAVLSASAFASRPVFSAYCYRHLDEYDWPTRDMGLGAVCRKAVARRGNRVRHSELGHERCSFRFAAGVPPAPGRRGPAVGRANVDHTNQLGPQSQRSVSES